MCIRDRTEALLAHQRSTDRSSWGWNWSAVKIALEHLFWAGRLTSAGRTPQFERRYAATRAVLPAGDYAAYLRWSDPARPPQDAAATLELTRIAARALGVGSVPCLADYFRLPPAQVAPAVEALVAAGELEPVAIAGWRRTAYLDPASRRPRELDVRALVSPFDSLVWRRERTEACLLYTSRCV